MSDNPATETMNVNVLGYYLDGWAEVIEGMGEKANEVSSQVLLNLKEREMPNIFVEKRRGIVSLTSSEERDYLITTTSPGATTAIRISKHGKDLYASWRTFIRPVLNKDILIVAVILCSFLGLIGGVEQRNSFYSSSSSFSFGGWLGWTIGFLIITAMLLGFAGRFWKGNFLAFFFVEPTIFDADDITAMSISTHKSILRALDSTGFDVSKLRLKQSFKGGRRGEEV